MNTLPSSLETGSLGVMHLKRYWAKSMAIRNGKIPADALMDEWNLDRSLLNLLGLGLEQTIRYLYQQAVSFEQFEQWVKECNGGHLNPAQVTRFNDLVTNPSGSLTDSFKKPEELLSPEQMQCWQQNGYVILPAVCSKEDCENTVDLICRTIGVNRYDSSTWYNPHPMRQGIMIQLFQDPQLDKNRQIAYVKEVYQALWGRTDLLVSADRLGFNPPETTNWHFPGPHMHWDVSLKLPVPFGLQGILYLTDTAENQGAFSLVPGFHHRIEEWIHSLPPGRDPRTENIFDLGVKPIAAGAGDFIIWHHALPHGSSPNRAALPRYVQYINWAPADESFHHEWI